MIVKVIVGIIAMIVGIVVGVYFCISQIVKPTVMELRKSRELSNKHLKLYMLMNDWVYLKQKGINLEKFFVDNGYRRIAIYGINYVGKALLNELSDTNVKVVVGIDKANGEITDSLKIVKPEEFSEDVEAVIVTPITYFDDIADMMEKKTEAHIISIEDIIYDLKYGVK